MRTQARASQAGGPRLRIARVAEAPSGSDGLDINLRRVARDDSRL
jgi:hypothetical protein